MNDAIARLDSSRIALRVSFGLLPLWAGLEKVTYLLTDWSAYVGPVARSLLPVDAETILYAAGRQGSMPLVLRIDTPIEAAYFSAAGILSDVLDQLLAQDRREEAMQ